MYNTDMDKEQWDFERVRVGVSEGLSTRQVEERVQAGAVNHTKSESTLSTKTIIRKNVFTLFNAINLFLAVCVVLVGAPKQALFFGVAVANTLMGIFQELRAKRTLDKLAILARGKVTVVRDGEEVQIDQEEVVVDDILILKTGNQVVADGEVVKSEGFEVDESLLTGEADAMVKDEGSEVLSGSFVVAGRAYIRVSAVGHTSYAGRLAMQAKQVKKPTAPLMNTLNKIIRVLAVIIVPVGVLLFYQQFQNSGDLQASVIGATAAMVGMIPEGLVLLTGVTLTLGAVKLARRRALVQALPSIETLARVDVLCLDKTGTITDGTLSFEEIVPKKGVAADKMSKVLSEMMSALGDDNATAVALGKVFEGGGKWKVAKVVPFSSEKKWSGVDFGERGSYVIGAPSFVLSKVDAELTKEIKRHTAQGQRVLCLAQSDSKFRGGKLPSGLSLVGLIILSDHIRPEAKGTFAFFAKEGVMLKVISGDDAQTVSVIAGKAGIEGAEHFIDMNSHAAEGVDFGELVQKYTVFGRVKPEQKKMLVAALKEAGHTVCMTGDGVNDVLALKESDCGVVMINGSDAARASADFVLMTGDFSAMVDVLKEGRRVINNIELVACLYLVKTIYSTMLALIYAMVPYPYPFAPLQMTPINVLTVGVPSFFLALRGMYDKPRGRFLVNVFENAVPAAVIIVFGILTIQGFGLLFGLSQATSSTMNVILTATIGFGLLYKVSQPLKRIHQILIGTMFVGFLVCLIPLGNFFGYVSLWDFSMLLCVPIAWGGYQLFKITSGKMHLLVDKYERRFLR